MKRLLFIFNPKAGKTAIKTEFFEIILTFSRAGYEVVTYPTTGPDDAERKVREDGANYDLIVCAGGDGTLENTVSGYMQMGEKKVPIGYIPVGTTNDFARSLKISRKPLEAAYQIVNGETSLIDVGQFEDKYFIYIAAFGIFTDISYNTKQSLKKVMGHSAYVIEAFKNVANYKSYHIEADLDGKVVTGEYVYGMITNSFSVAGFKIRGAKHVILDDGKFDCLFVKAPKTVNELQQILTAVLYNNIEDNEMFFECKANRVEIKSSTPMPWTLDGEYGGDKESVCITNIKQAVGIVMNKHEELASFADTDNEIAASVDNEISSELINDSEDEDYGSWD